MPHADPDRRREYARAYYATVTQRKKAADYRSSEAGRAWAAAYYRANRERILEKNRRWRRENQDKVQEAELRRRCKKFGIEPAVYVALFESQKGVCAICRNPERRVVNGRPSVLAVDHDHDTGAVRGLLCHSCNTALGGFSDSVGLLRLAVRYLERHR